MEQHYIVKTDAADPTDRQVLCGAEILSNNPVWERQGFCSFMQPMLFRDRSYAIWVKDTAVRKDTELSAPEATYEVKTLTHTF